MKLAPSPAGAYLNGSANGGGSSATQIVLDTLDAGYPYTRLSGGTLTVEAAGPVTVTGASAMTLGYTLTVSLRVNGSTVATGSNGSTSTISYSYQAHAGDTLQLWETDSSFGAGPLTTGSAATYLHVVPTGPPNFTGLPTTLMRANMH